VPFLDRPGQRSLAWENASGRSSAWQSAAFGSRRSPVQIRPPRLGIAGSNPAVPLVNRCCGSKKWSVRRSHSRMPKFGMTLLIHAPLVLSGAVCVSHEDLTGPASRVNPQATFFVDFSHMMTNYVIVAREVG
jgi:hypothetical protein